MKKKSSVVFKNIKPIDSELWKVAKLQTREFSEKFLLKIEVKMDENAPTEDEIMVNESTGIHRTVENVLSLLMRLRQAASRCYETSEAGDIRGSEKALNEFVGILTDVVKSANESPENDEIKENAFEVLREIQSLITSSDPSSQVLLDLVALDLPRVIVNYWDISENCQEICDQIISYVCQSCSPRDMVPVLCEALLSLYENNGKSSSCLPLLHGFSIVISRIQQRHVEHMKSAMPVILTVGKSAVSTATYDDDEDTATRIFEKLIAIAMSMQELCKKQVVDEKKNQLRSILGLYILQLLALVSKHSTVATSANISKVPTLVLQILELLSYCWFSYLGLITGRDTDVAIRSVVKHNDDHFQESTSLVNVGAALAVLWGYMFMEVATVACENVETLVKKLQGCKSEKLRALNMMKCFLSQLDYPWQLQKHGVDFLLTMVKADSAPSKDLDEKIDWSSTTPSLFALLQALQRVMVYAPDSDLRKKAFSALTEVLAWLPPHQKFDTLKALIMNSNYPSMVSLLLGIVRNEVASTIHEKNASKSEESPFVTGDVLELVEFVLKPMKGGPPDLPAQTDAVLAALNLYRFMLMIESHGKTNYTGVLSKSCLQKAYSEWLLPLRVLVSGIQSENANDHSEFATSTKCALNPIELVLYLCLELVEECLKHSL